MEILIKKQFRSDLTNEFFFSDTDVLMIVTEKTTHEIKEEIDGNETITYEYDFISKAYTTNIENIDVNTDIDFPYILISNGELVLVDFMPDNEETMNNFNWNDMEKYHNHADLVDNVLYQEKYDSFENVINLTRKQLEPPVYDDVTENENALKNEIESLKRQLEYSTQSQNQMMTELFEYIVK